MGLFSDIALIARNRTTYEVGLLQARGYRTLKHMTAAALKGDGISTIDWALLGIIVPYKAGVTHII